MLLRDTRAFSGWAAEFRRQIAAHRLDVPGAVHPRTASVSSLPCVFRNKCSCFLLKLRQRNAIVWKGSRRQECRFLLRWNRKTGEIAILRDLSSMVLRMSCARPPNGRVNSWRRHPIARIGVILFDLERKLPQVESAFGSVLHPEHLLGQKTASAFEIASPRALAEYPVVRCALDLLSLFAAPIEFHCFHSMLSSPYLAAEPDAAARFLGGMRKNARLQVSFDDLARWLQKSHDLPEFACGHGRLPKHSAFSSEQAAAYWADIARRILEAFGWPGGVPLNSEEFQCTESWRELLVSVSSLELLDWRTDFKGFVERLKRAAATRNFKPETLNAPVQIMNAAESEGSIFDALWIGSASDDLWPDSPRLSPLIPVALLKAAGVALVGSPQAEARISRITSRLLQSAPLVSLSLARRTDDEREQRWSPCFTDFPLTGETIELPALLAASFESRTRCYPRLHCTCAPTAEAARGGTSLLQEQSNCPFRAFAIRRLLAREDEGPNDALAPTERGKVIDLALQLIWEQLKDSADSIVRIAGQSLRLPWMRRWRVSCLRAVTNGLCVFVQWNASALSRCLPNG